MDCRGEKASTFEFVFTKNEESSFIYLTIIRNEIKTLIVVDVIISLSNREREKVQIYGYAYNIPPHTHTRERGMHHYIEQNTCLHLFLVDFVIVV